MDDSQEIQDLLREIRDLQKAHLELAREFQKGAVARYEARTEDTRRARKEQLRVNEEIRDEYRFTLAELRRVVGGPGAIVPRMVFYGVMFVISAVALFLLVFRTH